MCPVTCAIYYPLTRIYKWSDHKHFCEVLPHNFITFKYTSSRLPEVVCNKRLGDPNSFSDPNKSRKDISPDILLFKIVPANVYKVGYTV